MSKQTLYKVSGVGKWVWDNEVRIIFFQPKGSTSGNFSFNLPQRSNNLEHARATAAQQEVYRLRQTHPDIQARNRKYREEHPQAIGSPYDHEDETPESPVKVGNETLDNSPGFVPGQA